MKVIVANYGNESLALIQWAIEQGMSDVEIISIDTGWHSANWPSYLATVFDWLDNHNVTYHHRPSSLSMSDAITDRRAFPNKKNQWCAPFLKGLIINEVLDDIDPGCEADVWFAKRKEVSRANHSLQSGLPSELLNDRVVAYPILDLTAAQRDELIIRAGFQVRRGASQECFPCIHTSQSQIQSIQPQDMDKLERLEKLVDETMFEKPIQQWVAEKKERQSSDMESYDMGCGNVWGCGD